MLYHLSVQVRTWPGSPPAASGCVDVDYWRGLKADTLYTNVFKRKCQIFPDLVRDMHAMPPSERATHTQDMDKFISGLNKKTKGIEVALQEFPILFNEEDVEDLYAVLGMEIASTDTDTPFDWMPADMKLLFAPGDGDCLMEDAREPVRCLMEDAGDGPGEPVRTAAADRMEEPDDPVVRLDDNLVDDYQLPLIVDQFYVSRPNTGTR